MQTIIVDIVDPGKLFCAGTVKFFTMPQFGSKLDFPSKQHRTIHIAVISDTLSILC